MGTSCPPLLIMLVFHNYYKHSLSHLRFPTGLLSATSLQGLQQALSRTKSEASPCGLWGSGHPWTSPPKTLSMKQPVCGSFSAHSSCFRTRGRTGKGRLSRRGGCDVCSGVWALRGPWVLLKLPSPFCLSFWALAALERRLLP